MKVKSRKFPIPISYDFKVFWLQWTIKKIVRINLTKINTGYRTVSGAIWQIFSVFLIFYILFHEPLDEWNNRKIWETREIFDILCEATVRQPVYRYHKNKFTLVQQE